MFRTTFPWEVQVRRELVVDELARLRELPYSLWRGILDRPLKKTARARDNRTYRLRTSAHWAQSGSENIRVSVALESTTLGRRLLSQSFVITPENSFRE